MSLTVFPFCYISNIFQGSYMTLKKMLFYPFYLKEVSPTKMFIWQRLNLLFYLNNVIFSFLRFSNSRLFHFSSCVKMIQLLGLRYLSLQFKTYDLKCPFQSFQYLLNRLKQLKMNELIFLQDL